MITLINRLLLTTISISSLLFLPIGGCTSEYETRSYISHYAIIDHIHVEDYIVNNSDSCLFFSFKLISYEQVSIASKGKDKKLYNKICAMNGDTSFCGIVEKDGFFISGGGALYPNISAINLTSSVDFDAEHPAGTPLNDCFELEYSNYERFNDDGIVQKRTKLSDIKEIKCIATRNCSIYYSTPPTSKRYATITLTITSDNGKVYEVNFTRMI